MVSLISFVFEHPRSWCASIDAAVAQWPTATFRRLAAGDAVDSAPLVQAWFRDEPLAGLPIPVGPSAVSAMVIGRHAMQPKRLTSWFRRVTAPISEDDGSALAALGTPDVAQVFALPAGEAAATVAREAIRESACGLERLDDLVLLVSELTTNAVLHAGGAQELAFHRSRGAVVIALTDRSVTSAPAVGRLGTSSPTGRGMAIIDSISDHWGVSLAGSSKTVWCEVLLDGTS